MTIPFWCLGVTVLIPYVLAGLGAWQRQAQFGMVDNRNWRAEQLPKLTGLGARVYAAQANAWEALGMFTAAVAVAHLSGADPDQSALAAGTFLTARLLHGAFYLADLDKLRTGVFLIGWGSCLWLFGLATVAG